MGLFDQHLHSRHSFDCKTEPRANVETAIAKGLSGLTFTEHFDTHPDDWERCVFNDADYSATIARLGEEFGGAIFIGKGIEVCYQLGMMDYVLNFLDRHRFDVVILSVHYFGGVTVHQRAHWEGVDAVEGTRRYLEHVLEAARLCERLHRQRGRVFDVLGHLDLAKRYTKRFLGGYDMSPFGGLIDEILAACLAADLTPEINTSSLRQGLDETMPNEAAAARYAALGGKAMSLGSDAHRAEDVGAGFDRAAAILRAAGLEHIAVFQQRKQYLLPTRVE